MPHGNPKKNFLQYNKHIKYVDRHISEIQDKQAMKKQVRTRKYRTTEPSTLDANRALDLVVALMKVPGPSCHEEQITKLVRRQLTAAGIPAAAITTDNAHKKSPAGGSTGNLIVKLPGTIRAPRRMLMAHLDTVPLCVGCRPIQRGDSLVFGKSENGSWCRQSIGCCRDTQCCS